MTKREQLKELIWYIATNHPRKLAMTKLWKLCFFSEADFYESFSERLTTGIYIKNRFGPTPEWKIAETLITQMKDEGLLIESNGFYVGSGDLKLKNLDLQYRAKIKVPACFIIES